MLSVPSFSLGARFARKAPLVIVQQDAAHGPGLLLPWARSRRIGLRVIRLDRGEALPDAASAIVLGAPRLPAAGGQLSHWMDASDRPLLALGAAAHVLARGLGGEVRRAAVPHVGWTSTEPDDPSVVPGPWLAWQHEVVELPPGVPVAAAGDHGAQVFGDGRRTGVVFRAQATPEMVERWADELEDCDDIAAAGRRHAVRARAAAFGLFDGWAARAGLFGAATLDLRRAPVEEL